MAVSFCLVCGKTNFLGRTCPSCYKKNLPERLVVGFCYKGLVKKLIMDAKYSDCQANLQEISVKLAKLISDQIEIETIITYIPLTREKERFRGFNQSRVIAKVVAGELGIRCESLLKRRHKDYSQVEISTKSSRLANVKGVFTLGSIPIGTKKIILIDDVTTTGATLLEASKVLKKACKKVVCVALAH